MKNSFSEKDSAIQLAEKEAFDKVKEYLRCNPGSNAMQIAVATGVSVSEISRFVRNGTLKPIPHKILF